METSEQQAFEKLSPEARKAFTAFFVAKMELEEAEDAERRARRDLDNAGERIARARDAYKKALANTHGHMPDYGNP